MTPENPPGFPGKMVTYDFFRRINNWTPRQVDELRLEELEWFPIQESARQEAQAAVQKIEEARWKQENR